MKHSTRLMAMLTAFTALSASTAFADDVNMPHVQQQGEVQFVTGGVGDDERNAMEQMQKDFNLHIMSSNKDGAFVDNRSLVVLDKHKKEVLNTQAGPLFYATLPAGKYTVISTNKDGVEQKKTVTISKKSPARISFVW